MTTHDVLATEPARPFGVEADVDAFIALQETNRGTELAEVLTDDAVLDLNVPQWRFQVGGGLANEWDTDTLERQRREAPMVHDEQTGRTR